MHLRFQVDKTTKIRFPRSRAGLLKGAGKRRFFLVKDSHPALRELGGAIPAFSLLSGEAAKSWQELSRLLQWLHASGAERSDTLVVAGGGAALDVGALAASVYRRGMGLVLIPTTLLAMVDASLGGKTAVDGEGGLKNSVGTFFPADEVWICLEFLTTLTRKERVSGAGECWKTLWLSGKAEDAALIEFVENGVVTAGLDRLVRHCLNFKRRVVEKDPLDKERIRECLNYGHTVGHALEALAAGRLPHGEAVLWGMAAESWMLKCDRMAERVLRALRDIGAEFPPEFGQPEREWARFFSKDKKVKNGKLEITVLSAPGRILRKKIEPSAISARIKGFREFARP